MFNDVKLSGIIFLILENKCLTSKDIEKIVKISISRI